MSLTGDALHLHEADFLPHLFPVGEGKKPTGHWRHGDQDYVEIRQSNDDMLAWAVDRRTHGYAVLTGGPARLYCLDLERAGMDDPGPKGDRLRALVEELPEDCRRTTVSGGRHLWVKITDDFTLGNHRLITRVEDGDGHHSTLLAEVRGHGGYAVMLGTGRGPLGNFTPYPMTAEKFRELVAELDALSDVVPVSRTRRERAARGEPNPARDWEARPPSDTADVLAWGISTGVIEWPDLLDIDGDGIGWQEVGADPAGWSLWLRPDYGSPTDTGHSAKGAELRGTPSLTVWSASVPWAESGETYSAADAFALSHGWTFAEAMALIEKQADGEGPLSWPEEIFSMVRKIRKQDHPTAELVTPITLPECDAVFRNWLGESYDLDTLHAVLAAAAAHRLPGEPVWIMVLSGPGNAKTETVQTLAAIGAEIVSEIASVGALLSATSKRDRSKDATGGLLRKIGDSGILVVKDFTSILSKSADMRAEVLGAMRETYDGRWSRDVGTDGGQTLVWEGRLTVVAAVTSAWDRHHAVISAMGDRFVLIRSDSTTGRIEAGRQALLNTGTEATMRAELRAAVAGVLAGMTYGRTESEESRDALLQAADLVTLARTNVERDRNGNPISADAPEAPQRLVKQLQQIVRGGMALRMNEADALKLALRCAADCVPPKRLAILRVIAAEEDDTGEDWTDAKVIRNRLDVNRTAIDRELQAMNLLGLLSSHESDYGGQGRSTWSYRLHSGVHPKVLG